MSYPPCGGAPPVSLPFAFAEVDGASTPITYTDDPLVTLAECAITANAAGDRLHVEGFANASYNDGTNSETVFSLVHVESSTVLCSSVNGLPAPFAPPGFVSGALGWVYTAAAPGVNTFRLVAATRGPGTTGTVGGPSTPGTFASLRVKNEGQLHVCLSALPARRCRPRHVCAR